MNITFIPHQTGLLLEKVLWRGGGGGQKTIGRFFKQYIIVSVVHSFVFEKFYGASCVEAPPVTESPPNLEICTAKDHGKTYNKN